MGTPSIDLACPWWHAPAPMEKERPLWHKVYFEPVYTAVAREIGYRGCLYRELLQKIEALGQQFDKDKIEAAVYRLATFEGQMTANPNPEAEVKFREEARKIMWQLLGPPPEYKPVDMYAAIRASGERLKADPTPPEKPKRTRRKQAPVEPPPVKRTKVVDPPGSLQNSPVMQQWREAKESHPGMLLLFRIGDFYELFEQDAETAAKELGLTLTSREKSSMVGFPHHSLERYLSRLLQAGHRVAICEQVEEPPPRKTAKREITRVVSPQHP
ncbi:MAG: hypothetical protein U0793_20040 [Gemmataceae bacterium]